jgi:hypothetical protein
MTAAQLERIRELQRQGYTVVVGPTGVTVFDFRRRNSWA